MGLTTRSRTTKGARVDARLNFYENTIGAKLSKQIHAAASVVIDSALPHSTQALVRIRASQINGSSFCTDIHAKDAAQRGGTSLRLNLIATWHEASAFTEAERAALELTEQGTRLSGAVSGVPDGVWANVCKHYDEDQLAALVSQIALINTFNRMNVITRQTAGHHQLVKLHEREYPSRRRT
jgi:AhpD family alkylhydroperoxidase